LENEIENFELKWINLLEKLKAENDDIEIKKTRKFIDFANEKQFDKQKNRNL
jgi:hypothetical protein